MSATTLRPPSPLPWLTGTLAALLVWALLYSQLVPFSDRAVSLLLMLVVFAMGVVRNFFSPERTRALLAGRREGVGNAMAASLGITLTAGGVIGSLKLKSGLEPWVLAIHAVGLPKAEDVARWITA